MVFGSGKIKCKARPIQKIMTIKATIDPQTLLLKSKIPIGNYYLNIPISAHPYKSDSSYDINQVIIPKKDAFLILDLFATAISNRNTKYAVFIVLWNSNKHLVRIDYAQLKNMWHLSERGPVNMEMLL